MIDTKIIELEIMFIGNKITRSGKSVIDTYDITRRRPTSNCGYKLIIDRNEVQLKKDDC